MNSHDGDSLRGKGIEVDKMSKRLEHRQHDDCLDSERIDMKVRI